MSATSGATPVWSDVMPAWLSNSLNHVARWLSVAAVLGGVVAAAVALPMSNRLPFLTCVLMIFPAVVVHELGHAMAARCHRMRVLEMYMGAVHILPLKRGLRWRIASPPRGTLGMVHAIPDPDRPWLRGMLWLTAGGPLANVAVALALLPLTLWNDPSSGYAMAFLLINAGFFLANLLPFTSKHHASDGWQWLQWRYCWREGARELSVLRLLSLSVAGTTAERMPVTLLQQIESLGLGGELLVAWTRLKASQNEGRWDAVDAIDSDVQRILHSATPSERAGLKWTVALLQLESAFSRAAMLRDAQTLSGVRFERELRWRAPHIEHRFAALEHALASDHRRCERRLAQAGAAARTSQDLALHESEARIARHVLAMIGPA